MINMNWAQNISIIIGLLFEFYSAWILIKHVFLTDEEFEYEEATKHFSASKKDPIKEKKKGKKALKALIIGITFQIIALLIPY